MNTDPTQNADNLTERVAEMMRNELLFFENGEGKSHAVVDANAIMDLSRAAIDLILGELESDESVEEAGQAIYGKRFPHRNPAEPTTPSQIGTQSDFYPYAKAALRAAANRMRREV